jgi:uncharacterized protein (TIGR03643 family)
MAQKMGKSMAGGKILQQALPKRKKPTTMTFSTIDMDRIIEMAWEDRTPFDAITAQFGLTEAAVIALMRRELKPSSFALWRRRTNGRATKHAQLRQPEVGRFKCSRQKTIARNKISKR